MGKDGWDFVDDDIGGNAGVVFVSVKVKPDRRYRIQLEDTLFEGHLDDGEHEDIVEALNAEKVWQDKYGER